MAIASARSLMFSIRAASPHNPDPHLSPPASSCSPSPSSSSSSSHGISSTTQRLSMKRQLKDCTVVNNSRVVATATASVAALSLVSSSQQWVAKATEGGILSLQHAALVAALAGQALKAWGERVLSYRNMKLYNFSAAQAQASIEKVILDTRFSTLIAVAGSLLGSVVCFVNGCSLIVEAFLHYLHRMLQHAAVDQGETMHLLIEAIDMFLVGTGLLNFGMAMYIMFVGSRGTRAYTNLASSGSNLAGIFHQMIYRPSMGAKWVYHAKAKLGHAVVMILQAGSVEKFTNVPLSNGLDLACFAGAVLLSSATVFLLSRLHTTSTTSSSTSSPSGSGGDNQEAAEPPRIPAR